MTTLVGRCPKGFADDVKGYEKRMSGMVPASETERERALKFTDQQNGVVLTFFSRCFDRED